MRGGEKRGKFIPSCWTDCIESYVDDGEMYGAKSTCTHTYTHIFINPDIRNHKKMGDKAALMLLLSLLPVNSEVKIGKNWGLFSTDSL